MPRPDAYAVGAMHLPAGGVEFAIHHYAWPMLFFDLLAEQKIAAAIARGELAGLPGSGKPLDLSSDRLIPEELRMAYRILGNAGLIPPELECLREIGQLERLIDALAEGPQRGVAEKKLQLLRLRRDQSRESRRLCPMRGSYLRKILERLA